MKTVFTGIFLFISICLCSQEDEKVFRIYNNSNHTVQKIFDNKDPAWIRFHTALFKEWDIIRENDKLLMNFPNRESLHNRIEITADTVRCIMHPKHSNMPKDTIQSYAFRTNIRYPEDENDFQVEEIFDTVKFEFTNAIAVVYQEGNRCTDSGWNSIRVKFKNGDILLKNMNNIKFFETDLNNNGIPEIYIIHFSCCDEKMKIFRIE
jgi:hypothetical protein